MRDSKLLLSLLREMAANPGGRVLFVRKYGMSEEEQARNHHLEQLMDADHAAQTGDYVRITSAGYDFIAAVDNNSESMSTFLDLIKKGHPYLRAAVGALAIFNKLSGGGD